MYNVLDQYVVCGYLVQFGNHVRFLYFILFFYETISILLSNIMVYLLASPFSLGCTETLKVHYLTFNY